MSKSSNLLASAGQDNWKIKYQALLSELEQQQAQARAKSLQLVGIAQMLGAALPSDDASLRSSLQSMLDAALETPTPDRLPVQIDAFAQTIKTLQAERVQHAHAVVDALGQLSEQLQQATSDKQQLKSLQQFSRRLRKERSNSPNAHERAVALHLGQLRSSQRALLDGLEAGHATGEGWLSRLLGGKTGRSHAAGDIPATAEVAASVQQAPESVQASESEQSALATGSVVAGSPVQSGDQTLSDEVAAILIGLLASIEVPEPAQPQLQKLYADLQNGLSLGELVPILDDTAAIVHAALLRDQTEFANFLSSLDQRLEFFNQFAGELGEQLQGMARSGGQFDNDVVEQIQQLRAVTDGGDVQQLQTRITENLDTVARLLQEFSSSQQQHITALEGQLLNLQKQIDEMEGERQVAMQSIAAQRDKLLRDRLTGIANREAYDLRLDDEYKRWKRYARSLTLVVADIDLFKAINDNYGHAAGDKVLKIIATVMARQLRESDFIARYGGEEFVMLLPETDLDAAVLAIEKVRQAIESSPFNFKQQPVKVTCSFGLAEFAGEDTVEAVFNRADQALYQAKDRGRNCAVALQA